MTVPMAISGDPRLSFMQRLRNLLVPVPQAGGLLAPQDQQYIQRQGLQQLGAGLLQGGAPQAAQRGTLGNLGFAISQLDIPGAVQSAARMRLVTQEIQDRARARQAYEDISRKYPAMPGENAEQRFNRLSNIVSDLVGVPGSEELIGKLSNVLGQLKPPASSAEDWSAPIAAVGPDGKTSYFYQVHRRTGETRRLNIRPQATQGRPMLKVIPGVNGPEYAMLDPATGELTPTGQPASLTEAQQRANALAGLVEDANRYLETQLAPNRIQQLSAGRGLNEFLSANAEELEQASTQIADAYVRITSGAAAREEEYQRARKLITPYSGDNPATLDRKTRARARMLGAIRRGGGIAERPASDMTSRDDVPPRLRP